MARIYKQFPAPSVDNPALLGQFAHTLADRYIAMFPTTRGFAVELEDKTTKRFRRWEIRILHGKLGGTSVSRRPSIAIPQQISVTVLKTSRFEQQLMQWAVGLAMVLMVPFFLSGIFHTRLGFVLLVGVPIYFILAFALGMIATAIGRMLSRFDRHFDEGIRQRILNVANELPLPSTLLRPEAPAAQPPDAQDTMEALPKRTGPWPWAGLTGR